MLHFQCMCTQCAQAWTGYISTLRFDFNAGNIVITVILEFSVWSRLYCHGVITTSKSQLQNIRNEEIKAKCGQELLKLVSSVPSPHFDFSNFQTPSLWLSHKFFNLIFTILLRMENITKYRIYANLVHTIFDVLWVPKTGCALELMAR